MGVFFFRYLIQNGSENVMKFSRWSSSYLLEHDRGISEAFSESCETSKMECFAKIVDG